MLKKIITCALAGIMTLSLVGCSKGNEKVLEDNGKVNVVASFYAMEEFAKEIGKDKVNVYTVIPDGVEPHDFEPKAKDLAKIEEADVLVLNGAGMEHWSEDVVKAVNNKKLEIVDTSKDCDLIKIDDKDNEEDHDHDHDHEHLDVDPHLWLGLDAAQKQCENIKDALVKVDSENAKYYEENYKRFSTELKNMYDEYKVKFSDVKNKDFVTGHATFAYLCKDFGLNQISIEGVFAEGEPSPQKLKKLTDLCKEKNIKTVFVESLVSPQVSETLAKEIDGKTETIYTLHSKEDDLSYMEAMKLNLETIYTSLK